MKNLLIFLILICIMTGAFFFFLFDVQVPLSVSLCVVAAMVLYIVKEAIHVYHV